KMLKKIAKQNLPKNVQSKVELFKVELENKRQEIKELREKIKETKIQHFNENGCSPTQIDFPVLSNLSNTLLNYTSDYSVLITGSSCESRIVAPNEQFECKWVVKN
ncbi:hypothetical protein, partial [Salmonella sp. s51228]|uniref:hypothetical protein n=1 Tax=Salmonella sp. s51228 TaxID=3159652 RepID=UPI00397F8095